MSDFFDEDGYPTDEALQKIAKWSYSDLKGWIDFIRGLWHFGAMTWQTEHKFDEFFNRWFTEYQCSTFGWSGNESIITAMRDNALCWHFVWYSSRRGGHYVFRIEDEIESKET